MDRVIDQAVTIGGKQTRITCVSMGNPHCVVFVEDVKTLPLTEIGPKFEQSPLFPERVNTEFIQVLGPRELKMRVWERGSGGTMACGTGACAAVAGSGTNRALPPKPGGDGTPKGRRPQRGVYRAYRDHGRRGRAGVYRRN